MNNTQAYPIHYNQLRRDRIRLYWIYRNDPRPSFAKFAREMVRSIIAQIRIQQKFLNGA